MSLDFLGRSPWNLIFLLAYLLVIVALGWWAFEKAPWLNP